MFCAAGSGQQQDHHAPRRRGAGERGELVSAGVRQEGEPRPSATCTSSYYQYYDFNLPPTPGPPPVVFVHFLSAQALRSDSAASDGAALGETRRQLREETLLRLVSLLRRSPAPSVIRPARRAFADMIFIASLRCIVLEIGRVQISRILPGSLISCREESVRAPIDQRSTGKFETEMATISRMSPILFFERVGFGDIFISWRRAMGPRFHRVFRRRTWRRSWRCRSA